MGVVLVIAFLATQRLVDWTLEWMSHEVLQKGDDFHLYGPQNRELHCITIGFASGGNQPITCLFSRFGPPKKDKRSTNLVFNLINQTIKQFFSLPVKMGILYQHSNGAVSQF